jgi:hypothetical protein
LKELKENNRENGVNPRIILPAVRIPEIDPPLTNEHTPVSKKKTTLVPLLVV